MPAIHTSHHTASAIINAPAAPSASAPQTSSESLAAIDAKYPNLQADLDKARDDVAATAGSDTWAGLSWMEKAVFFLLPFGPLLGIVLMSQNGDIHRQAVNNLKELEEIAQLRAAIVAQQQPAMDHVA